MRSSPVFVVLATVTVVGAVACNESFVPDYNSPTVLSHSASAFQNLFTGAVDGSRGDYANFGLSMEGFARNAAYFTSSESRFVTQWTGEEKLDNSNFGADVWATTYAAIKTADSAIGILPTLANGSGPLPAANREAIYGALETLKALDYMYIAEAHDTNGAVMNGVGLPLSSPLAPILCNKDVWKQIVAMLDSAEDSLTTAGASAAIGIPGTNSANLSFPGTYSLVDANAGSFSAFTLALRGKARVEYAYAEARSSSATAPTPTSAGSPDQVQLDSAIGDILASAPIYTATPNAAGAIPQNDVGVFQYFSTAPGDRTNSIGTRANAIYLLADAFASMDTADLRFKAKWALGTAPTSAGASIATPYYYSDGGITPSTPMTIVRNLELQFILAEAYLGTGQYVKAIQTVDAVRTVVGGLASDSATLDAEASYTVARDFLLQEQQVTLIMDGSGDRTVALREFGMVTVADTTWAPNDYQTSLMNIPLAESNARSGNITPSCP